MSRKLPETHVSSRERRSVRRLAFVLWAGLFLVLFAFVGVTLAGVTASADAPVAVTTDRPTSSGGDVPNATNSRGVDARAAAETERAESIVERHFPGVDFSFDLDRESGLDFRLSTGTVDVRFAGLGGGDARQSGTIRHDAIDEGVSRSSRAGLCVVGLTAPDSPLSLDVDPRNSSVSADLSSNPHEPANESSRERPESAVQGCRTDSA